jgi:1-deoxy-D-xylulose-5-phosphate synthase
MFDIGYLRILPNLVVMAPGDAWDLREMLAFALAHSSPCTIRYPKAAAEEIGGARAPIEAGRAEVLEWGEDGCIVCCGTLVSSCLRAAELLAQDGLEVGVVNARFVKPIDEETILKAIRNCGFVVTVEEGALMGGFGSAVLETASRASVDASRVRRLGAPDAFIEHGEREELLAALDLTAEGIAAACRQLAHSSQRRALAPHRRPA